ncbi:MAG: metallophosphoesterase [Ignavibacteria bacterium]|nr:metallophosphoesterase [Ignavibacteria bacterium]
MNLPNPLQKYVFVSIALLLGILAVIAPIWPEGPLEPRLGMLLVITGVLEILHGFRRATDSERKSAWFSASITLMFGVLLINASIIMGTALIILIAVSFFIDGVKYGIEAFRNYRKGSDYKFDALAMIGNFSVIALIFFTKNFGADWTIALAGAWRIFGTAVSIFNAKEGVIESSGKDVIESLGLPDNPSVNSTVKKIMSEEVLRRPVDKGWILLFLILLFAIHLGRMGFDKTALGILSPGFALFGDIVIALIITFGIITPLKAVFRKFTAPLSRKLWTWVDEVPAEQRKWYSLRRVVNNYLERRLRVSIRLRNSGYSYKTAFMTGMQTGLPYAAMFAAIIPVFGMSWYFDTENWAAGIWDSWAASRTNEWRMAIAESSGEIINADAFRLLPEGVNDNSDFSFIVIGDPGEGDASQLCLKDQIQIVSEKPDVKFLIISTDIVYPSGEMKDYENKFWLPMKGISKPVYAIPGNHDWYDALEGFTATFFDPKAAYDAMIARVNADLKFSASTEGHINKMIKEAERLKTDYGVKTGFQKSPYFQIQTDKFAFITIETGVTRTIDDIQMEWLKQVLEASKGKYIMILIGHPFYAIGEYQGNLNPDFEALHQLLRDYKVNLVMGGDTHDLEYYVEHGFGNDPESKMYHFVNGGGGAYLSIGAAMKPKDQMPEKEWAHYPATEPLVKKIEDNNNILKAPAWYWTKNLGGWPFNPEFLSAAFDYNKSPFFQSFFEIKIEPSKGTVSLIPYGVNGQLKWKDIETSDNVRPPDKSMDSTAEWVFPMTANLEKQ